MLLSGGDPLTIGDDKLDWLLGRLRAIKHIEFLRIGTKMPVVPAAAHHQELAQHAEEASPAMDEHPFHPPGELTDEVTEATARLADAGIPAGQPDGAAQGHQRRHHGHDSSADAGPAEAPGEALLPLPVRSDPRLGPFPHHGREGAGDHRQVCAATPPDMRRRCSASTRRAAAARSRWRPIPWSAATATTCCCAISRARFIATPIPAARWAARRTPRRRRVSKGRIPMRIGVTLRPPGRLSRHGLWRGGNGRVRQRDHDRGHLRGAGTVWAMTPVRIGGVRKLARAIGGGRALGCGVQFLRGAEGRGARGAGAGAAGGL